MKRTVSDGPTPDYPRASGSTGGTRELTSNKPCKRRRPVQGLDGLQLPQQLAFRHGPDNPLTTCTRFRPNDAVTVIELRNDAGQPYQ
jgi:hypothetical protein